MKRAKIRFLILFNFFVILLSMTMLSRVLKKFQLTDSGERKLFTDKLRKEIDNLESWFVQMASKVIKFKNLIFKKS